MIPAFGTEVGTRKRLEDKGLRAGGHHLRRRDERLETRPAIFQGKRHQHHSRQGVARGNQGHQFAGARLRQRTLSRRLQPRGDGLRLPLHRARRRQTGISGKVQGRVFAGVRSGTAFAGRRRGEPDHHVARRNRGGATPLQGRHGEKIRRGKRRRSISASSTRFAARRRTGRTRSKNCCASR